jgi:hypothetical protein
MSKTRLSARQKACKGVGGGCDAVPMARWTEIAAEAPDLVRRVEQALDAHKHKVLATLRADGSPRVSGTELDRHEGDLYLGSMPDARKARDLQRDPRFALHSAPLDDKLADVPDVKLAGTVEEITGEAFDAYVSAKHAQLPPGPFHLFRLDVTEVALTRVEGDELVVESWHPGRGVQTVRRR